MWTHRLQSARASTLDNIANPIANILLLLPAFLPFAPSHLLFRLLLLNGRCESLLGHMLLHIPDRVDSPGDCFWMGWWGYAKREEFLSVEGTAPE